MRAQLLLESGIVLQQLLQFTDGVVSFLTLATPCTRAGWRHLDDFHSLRPKMPTRDRRDDKVPRLLRN